jgi:hypothetical protein
MARIRSVHPGLFIDDAFMELSMAARVLLIGIWVQCDDHGIFEWRPKSLKAAILPGDDKIAMADLLDELTTERCIQMFVVEGKKYGAVRNFCIFQRPKKPSFKYPLPDQLRTYVAVDRRRSEEVGTEDRDQPGPSGKLLEDRSPTGGGNTPQREEDKEQEEVREKENLKPNSESVVVSLPVDKSENSDNSKKTTTTTASKGALQGKKTLGALIGTPLPPEWVPDDQLCGKVLVDFGMSIEQISTELPTFHALNVQNGTMSQDWSATFYLFAKRWKERQARAAPRLELNKMPGTEPISSALWTPTEANWESEVKRYAATGRWSAQFGPDPESAACRCPPHILAKLPNPAAIPVLAKKAAAS